MNAEYKHITSVAPKFWIVGTYIGVWDLDASSPDVLSREDLMEIGMALSERIYTVSKLLLSQDAQESSKGKIEMI